MEGSSNQNSQASTFINDLLCQEDKSCLNEEDEHKVSLQLPNSQPVLDDSVKVDDDYIQILVQKERNSPSNSSFSSSNYPSWLKDSRVLAINWILNTVRSFGFQNQTAYLSVIYLDRFLSRRFIYEDQSWAVALLSVACLSLASKMDECKLPSLSEFQVENCSFNGNVIQKMELMILTTLDWKMSLITPFVYINYFIKELGDRDSNQDGLISRVTGLIMALIRESHSIEDYQPFVVAAAAVMAGFDWQLTKEMLITRINTVTLWRTSNNWKYLAGSILARTISTVSLWQTSVNLQKQQEEEQLIRCYTLMQRLCFKDNPGTPNLPEVDQTTNTTPSLAGTKRSLTFRDSNQDPDLPD